MIGGSVGLVITAMRFDVSFKIMPFRIVVFGVGMLLLFGIGLFGLFQRKPKTIVRGRTI